jgi:BASS family bile acid:Na+ symporter
MFRWITRHMAVLTFISAMAAYLHPPWFLIFKDSFLWFFAATMFALGTVLDHEEARDTLSQPLRVLQGVVCQYLIMPLLGFAAATVTLSMGYAPELALGFIIVGCAPGAMASNVITYLAGGAVAFSIAMTVLATLISPVITPALVRLLGGVFLDIPFWPMMWTILITVVLPLALGIFTRFHLGHLTEKAEAIAPGIATISIIIICSYAVAANHDRIASMAGLVFGLVILLNALGYVAGWLAGGLLGFDLSHRITIAIEIGMQNAGLGVALALKHFTPETALPGALFAVWCIMTAAGFSRYLQRKRVSVAAV